MNVKEMDRGSLSLNESETTNRRWQLSTASKKVLQTTQSFITATVITTGNKEINLNSIQAGQIDKYIGRIRININNRWLEEIQ